MGLTRNQQTIVRPCAIEGAGYWSGRSVRVEFRPAEADAGIVFVRRDLPGNPRIAATAANRTDMRLRTNLRSADGAEVEMVEHITAALGGLHVDNCEVWVDGQEMPGCDGSSQPFVELLVGAGIVAQGAPRARLVIRETIRIGSEHSWIEARPCCSGKTILQYELDYGDGSPIARQTQRIVLSPEAFCRGLAPSRTFLLQQEAAALQAQGLGLRTRFQDLLVFGPEGPIENVLRFPDECVRHKLLDLVGDLTLAGRDVAGRIHACRSGHRLNAELVRAITAAENQEERHRRCA